MNSDISTLGEFLEQTDTQYRIFDLGRRIVPLPKQQFADIERGAVPYPYPLQQHAWLGILCWGRHKPEERFIWFIRLPLDEQARLVGAARDDFLHRVVEALGTNIESAAASGSDFEDALNDNPYGFKPREDRMAPFHALALKRLGLPPSRFFDHAVDYLRGGPGWDQWAFVGLQGLADVAARLDEADLAATVAHAIPELPEQPLQALCSCLENTPIPTRVAEALRDRTRSELGGDAPNERLVAATLRGLAGSDAAGLRHEALGQALQAPAVHGIELFAAIAARLWDDLREPDLGRRYLEALAALEEQEAFNAILADLLYIPGMREPLMALLRHPERTERLGQAIGALFAAVGR